MYVHHENKSVILSKPGTSQQVVFHFYKLQQSGTAFNNTILKPKPTPPPPQKTQTHQILINYENCQWYCANK